MTERRRVRIGDLCSRVTSGGTPSTKHAEYYGGSIPWLRTQEVDFNRITDTEVKITEEGLKNSSAKWIPTNAVIVAMYGATAGRIAIAKVPLTTNQACCNLIVDPQKADYRYVYYALMHNYVELSGRAKGSAQTNLNAGLVKEFEIPDFDLPTQKHIADILSAYDDLIENNRRRMEILEESARLIYRKMFGSKKKGTRLLHLEDFVECTVSGDWGKESSDRKCTEKIMCLRGADIPSLRYRDFGKGIVRFVTPQHVEARAMKDGDMFVEMSGGSPTQATGRVGLVSSRLLRDAELPVLCTNFCRVVRPKTGYAFFLYLAWLDLYDQDLMFMFEHSAIALKNFDLDLFLKKILIVKPEDSQLREFNEKIAGVMDQMDVLGGENRRLIKARDILLPKLMSGELEGEKVKVE